ncbi:hypothetical protein B0W47_10385 [Komagataeibacter nataicola]|uniref:Uncharacterized protein n=1 Tax=Komagataeibacter nataicola TaxID=265960 RepID=A0A9N7CVJ9_9PROT|nr:hypothetical protein B0W47_10385 [Komagataeibacter nataicola]PYD66214.1 hypothetical protein CDI09_09435 [Komagataeibacter nataicola]
MPRPTSASRPAPRWKPARSPCSDDGGLTPRLQTPSVKLAGFFILKKFLVKLFSKSFKERRLFEKRRHPKTFIPYLPYCTHTRENAM